MTDLRKILDAVGRKQTPIDPVQQVAIDYHLKRTTILFDPVERSFYFRDNRGGPVAASIALLARYAGLSVEQGKKHPVTHTNDAIILGLNGENMDPVGVNHIQMQLLKYGCFFKDGQKWVRETDDPRELPPGHDCLSAPLKPHPLARFGPLFLDQRNVLNIALDGLSPTDIQDLRNIVTTLWPENTSACIREGAVAHPVTKNRANIAIFAGERDFNMIQVWQLPNCFRDDGQSLIPRWINSKGQTLSRQILERLAPDIECHAYGMQDIVLLPLSTLKPVERVYLDQIVREKAPEWGVTTEGVKYAPDGTRLGLMAGMGNSRLRDFFLGLRDTSLFVDSVISRGSDQNLDFS